MILKLKEVLPNPFRDLKANPLIEEKIEELVGSINLTGFWDNVVVRKNVNGKYELAYGHHRIAAAIRAGKTEADFIVKVLDDAAMIQVMDSENRETYGSTPLSLIESVKAVVQSLAKGKIPPFAIDPKTRKDALRYAPSYVSGKPCGSNLDPHPYTVLSIATFLGRIKKCEEQYKAENSIVAALNALELKEKGHFSDSLLVTKDKTGAKTPITTNELLKITSDIKRDVVRVETRKEKTKEEIAALDREARAIEAERKAREKAIEEKEEQLLKEMKEARKAEDEKKAQEIQDRIKAANEAAKKKNEDDVVKLLDLEVKINERKEKEVEQRKEDLYVPIRKEVDRIVHLLERRDEEEELKALSRKGINPGDRERVRQAAMKKGSWFTDVIQDMFLPPISVNKKLSEYRSREESKRRAEETTKPAKKGKK